MEGRIKKATVNENFDGWTYKSLEVVAVGEPVYGYRVGLKGERERSLFYIEEVHPGEWAAFSQVKRFENSTEFENFEDALTMARIVLEKLNANT